MLHSSQMIIYIAKASLCCVAFFNRHYLAESVRIVKLKVMKYRQCSHVTLHLDCITSTCMDEKIKYLVNATVPFYSNDSKPKKPIQTYFEMICFWIKTFFPWIHRCNQTLNIVIHVEMISKNVWTDSEVTRLLMKWRVEITQLCIKQCAWLLGELSLRNIWNMTLYLLLLLPYISG